VPGMAKGKKDVYRQCASVMVLRPLNVCSPSFAKASEGKSDACGTLYQALLVHKPRKKDAWQLPQGGVEEGESIQDAALRELKEEAGITARLLGGCPHVYQYDFPASYRRFRPDNVCGQKVHYVFALAGADVRVRVDAKEIDASVWVLPEEFGRYLKRKEYLALVKTLYDECVKKAGDSGMLPPS